MRPVQNVVVTLVLILAGLALAAGCAAPTATHSGFLSNYDRLKPDPSDESVRWWEKPGVDWKKYKRLMLDPVEVRLDSSRAQRELTPAELKKVAASFRRIAVKVLSPRYPVVDRPGPDVLRVRAALTHVVPVNPVANIASVVMMGMPVDLAEAGIEVRFSDSLTGELLAEMTDFKRHSALTLNMGWRRWSQVEDLFEEWARELKKAMDEIHGAE